MLDYDEIARKFDDFSISLFEKIDIIGKLQKTGDRRAVEFIKTQINNSDQYIKREAVLALGTMGDRANVEWLLPVMDDSDSEVRKNAVVALGKMGGPQAEEAIQKALNDESWIVRYYAESSLATLREGKQQAPAASIAPLSYESSPAPSPELSMPILTSARAAESSQPSTVRQLSVEEVMQLVVQDTGMTREKNSMGYVLTVFLPEGRKQRVFISFREGEGDKTELIVFYTACGKASPTLYKWALTANAKMVYGGIALRQIEGEDYFTISYTTPFRSATVESLRRMINDIAAKGDWIEKNLTRGQEDRF
jgi:hypothetical protein